MAEITEKSFPFDSEEVDGKFDREYIADDFARYFRAFISSGVFMRTSTNLQVIANGDMTVTLKAGNIIIEGYRYELENDLVIQLDPADGVANRIDRVCITWSKSDRDIHYTLQKGEMAHVPVAVSVRRTAEYKDYAVADIYVAAGAISITQTAITDTRLDSEICGLATPFADFDTKTLYNKIEAYYSEMQKKTENWTKEEQEKFTVWFGGIRDQLSGDIGANLQLQIGVLKSLTTKDKTSLVAAINEINDPLDTLEEIEANTDAGRFAGALAVKEINSNLKDGLKMTEDERKMLEYIYKANGGSNIETDMKVVKYIGQGTSFDIKTLYPASYQNFTADNFFCEPISSNSGSTSPDTHGYEGSSFYANYSFNKTYNANTGVLSVTSIVNFNINFAQYGYLRSNQQKVKAYIVL